MKIKSLLSISDLSKKEIENIINQSLYLKDNKEKILKNKSIIFVFQKPSLRTKVATEIAIKNLGGNVINIDANNVFSDRESIKDVTKCLSQWSDAIFARVFDHNQLLEMKKFSSIPIINALCNKHHPMQALADLLTIKEIFNNKKISLTFIGDANNVAFSLFETLLIFGHECKFCGPE